MRLTKENIETIRRSFKEHPCTIWEMESLLDTIAALEAQLATGPCGKHPYAFWYVGACEPGCCTICLAEVQRIREEVAKAITPPEQLLKRHDEAADKAVSVGAFKMLKNAEAQLGRWLIEQLAALRAEQGQTKGENSER
jgi:hypothetical protein